MTDALRLVLYGLTSLALGYAVIALPAAGFLFRDPTRFGISDGQYGMLFLPMVIATIATGFGFRWIAAHFGRHRAFFLGFVLTGIYLLLLLAASFTGPRPSVVFALLMAAQASLGFGFALLMCSVTGFSIELFPLHRTSILTALHAAFGAGALLSPLVLDLWHRTGYWQGHLWVGLAELAIVGCAAFSGRSIPAAAPPAPDDADPAVTTGSANPFRVFAGLPLRAKGFVFALVLYGTLEAAIANWSSIYLTRERGFSPTAAAVCLSLFWGFLTLGRVLATVIAIRVETRQLFRFAPFVVVVGLLMLRGVRTEAEVFLPYMVIGLGCSYTFPVSVSITTRYHESRRFVLPSFMLAGLMTGVGLGSTAIGVVHGLDWFKLDQIFGSTAAVGIILCALFYVLTRKPLPVA